MVARQYAVWGGLLLTLAACYWVSQQDAEAIENTAVQPATAKKLAQKTAQEATQQLAQNPIETRPASHRNDGQIILRNADTAPPVDLFAPLLVAVGSAEETAANQAPAAPANPYSYAGKIYQDGEWTVFLTDGSANYAVKVGDKLDGGWQLKRLETQALTLVYAPMRYEVKMDI